MVAMEKITEKSCFIDLNKSFRATKSRLAEKVVIVFTLKTKLVNAPEADEPESVDEMANNTRTLITNKLKMSGEEPENARAILAKQNMAQQKLKKVYNKIVDAFSENRVK